MTGAERATLLGAAVGKPIAFQMLTDEQWRGAMARAELPSFIIDAVASMQAAQAEGAYDVPSGDVEALSGHAPRSLSTVLSEATAR